MSVGVGRLASWWGARSAADGTGSSARAGSVVRVLTDRGPVVPPKFVPCTWLAFMPQFVEVCPRLTEQKTIGADHSSTSGSRWLTLAPGGTHQYVLHGAPRRPSSGLTPPIATTTTVALSSNTRPLRAAALATAASTGGSGVPPRWVGRVGFDADSSCCGDAVLTLARSGQGGGLIARRGCGSGGAFLGKRGAGAARPQWTSASLLPFPSLSSSAQ